MMSDLLCLIDEQMARSLLIFRKSHGRERIGDPRGLSGIIFIIRNGLRWSEKSKENDAAKIPHDRWKRCSDMGSSHG